MFECSNPTFAYALVHMVPECVCVCIRMCVYVYPVTASSCSSRSNPPPPPSEPSLVDRAKMDSEVSVQKGFVELV